jgi:hypothetical protein
MANAKTEQIILRILWAAIPLKSTSDSFVGFTALLIWHAAAAT